MDFFGGPFARPSTLSSAPAFYATIIHNIRALISNVFAGFALGRDDFGRENLNLPASVSIFSQLEEISLGE